MFMIDGLRSYLCVDNAVRGFAARTFDNIRVWFNNKGWAASVSYMNAVNNVVLRAGTEEAGDIVDRNSRRTGTRLIGFRRGGQL